MANPILPNSSDPHKKLVQSCKRAKFARKGEKRHLLHDCTPTTLKFIPISNFYLQIMIGQQVYTCPADEFYFALLAALASGQEVSLDVLGG